MFSGHIYIPYKTYLLLQVSCNLKVTVSGQKHQQTIRLIGKNCFNYNIWALGAEKCHNERHTT